MSFSELPTGECQGVSLPPARRAIGALVINRFLHQPLLHLFNTPEYFRLHAGGSGNYFQWVIKGQACITLHLTDVGCGNYRSPARGTFGGLSFASDVSPLDVVDFLVEVENYLYERGACTVEILLAPMQHDLSCCSSQYFALRSIGFNELLVDLNYAMQVDKQVFAERVNYAGRKRLNKCRREGFQGMAVASQRLPEVYAVITENRASKGYPMTMSEQQLQEMQVMFPQALELYACEFEGCMVAAAICLRLSPEILYVSYWGDLPGYTNTSPVVMLAESIYLSCQDRGIKLLDVGTSTLNMQLNQGLINFKRGLGFQESLKFRLEKHFES